MVTVNSSEKKNPTKKQKLQRYLNMLKDNITSFACPDQTKQ